MALTFLARWFVRPDMKDTFVAALLDLKEKMPQSLFAKARFVNLNWNRQGDFIACECWEDEDAINAFRASPDFHAAIRAMTACCSRPLELEILDALDGDGAPFARYAAGRADPRYYPDLGPMTSTVV
jgi:quinol monooxygenase YgiN